MKLKVFSYPWHTGHQHSLAAMPWLGEYHMQVNPFRGWAHRARPEPPNLRWVTAYTPGEYDLCLLHLDQDSAMPGKKRALFTAIDEIVTDIPKIVINHMTPVHDHLGTAETIAAIRDLVGDKPMVVNSEEAARMWGFGTPIIHGFDPAAFPEPPGYREPRVVSFVSPSGMDTAYRRETMLAVRANLRQMGYPFVWLGVDHSPANFGEYLDYLSRSLIYYHGLADSPMPRSRTEAAHSGCCVATTPGHDADRYYIDGDTGVLVGQDDPDAVTDRLAALLEDPAGTRAIGERGRTMARERFGWERYAADWTAFLAKHL